MKPLGSVWSRRIVSAAAVLMAAAACVWFIRHRSLSSSPRFVTSPGTDVSVSHEFAPRQRANDGQMLEQGSRLQFRSGTMELELRPGIRAIVRGPADLTWYREDLLQIDQGTAWFRISKNAPDFKVSSPDLVVNGSGADFGVISDPAFPTEAHVFHGNVELRDLRGGRTLRKLGAGLAQAFGAETGSQPIPLRPDRFLTELPSSEPKQNLVLTREFSYEPLAYAGDVSASDLLQGILPLTTGWNSGNGASPKKLTDGIHGAGFDVVPGDKVQGAWTTVGATAEYQLGGGPNGTGFDLVSIRSIADWINVGFGNQAWTMEVKPVGGDWRTLVSVAYQPTEIQPLTGGGTTKVDVTANNGVLASGIEAIKVIAGRVPGSAGHAFVWRELDLFGQPADPPAGPPSPSRGDHPGSLR